MGTRPAGRCVRQCRLARFACLGAGFEFATAGCGSGNRSHRGAGGFAWTSRLTHHARLRACARASAGARAKARMPHARRAPPATSVSSCERCGADPARRFHPRYAREPQMRALRFLHGDARPTRCWATISTAPRGGIYLMKRALEGGRVTEKTRLHLDRCLTLHACETSLPRGLWQFDIGRAVGWRRARGTRCGTACGERCLRSASRRALFTAALRSAEMAPETRPGGAWPARAPWAKDARAARLRAARARALDQ